MNWRAAPSDSPHRGRLADLRETGFLDPIPIFTAEECTEISLRLRAVPPDIDRVWFKGNAITSRAYYDVASRRAVIRVVEELLGPNVMLWGANIVTRPPGKVHAWHTDIETSPDSVRAISVWIGLEHTNSRSSLLLVRGSHLVGKTIQQVAAERGLERGQLSGEDVERWVREVDPGAQIIQPDMSNGDALFFDGRLWHGSHNTNPEGERVALLLQYATSDSPLRIPDLSELEWPFRFRESPRPPCISLRGTYDPTTNRFCPPPEAEDVEDLSSGIHELELPLTENPHAGWKPYPIFRGRTATLTDLAAHVSILSPGRSPHPPHAHHEEELLIMLAGEADLMLGTGLEPELRTQRLSSGSFVYYPAHQTHTIRNTGSRACTYVMFKWRGLDAGTTDPLGLTSKEGWAKPATAMESLPGFKPEVLFAGKTAYLQRLQAHRTTLAPGAGYEPHADQYDVAIVVLDGVVATLGRQVAANSVIFYAAGAPHGMRNPGKAPATYLVFEFHAAGPGGPRESHPTGPERGKVRAWLRQRFNRLQK